jgi:hypothetical protein
VNRTALFVRWVLGILAVVFLLLGVACIFVPRMMIGAMDIQAEPGKALADIRAVYGGLDLAIGILLAVCFVRKEWATGLAIGTLVCTCIFGGRLVGIIWDPAQDILTFGLFASEVLGAVLAAVAWFLARQPEPAQPISTSAPSPSVTPAPTQPQPESETEPSPPESHT